MAVVVAEYDHDFDLNVGDRIEVLGFVMVNFELQAVYRDEAGYVWSIPVSLIRMVPNTSDAIVLSQKAYDAISGASV